MTPLELVIERLPGVRAAGPGQWSAPCPAHDDRKPSLSVSNGADGRVLLKCHACCSIDEICRRMGIEKRQLFPSPNGSQGTSPRASLPSFTAEKARTVWAQALQRARDDNSLQDDEAVYAYVRNRGLEESWESGPFGILAETSSQPTEIAHWPRRGYRLVAPLHDLRGAVVNLQSRRITDGKPKTLLPKGSAARGVLFATRSGRDLLRNGSPGGGRVILGEGLTDFLALSIVAPVPVLSVPGASFFAAAIGGWVAGSALYLAADNDAAGEAAIQPTAQAAIRSGARDVFAITWPEGCKDACDALAVLGSIGLAEFLEHELFSEGGADAVA